MSILLAHGDAEYDVALMDDLVPGSSDIKVMATGTQVMNVPVGAQVELRTDDASVAGTYTVTMTLGPAAPRNWRLYLGGISSSGVMTSSGILPASASPSGPSGSGLYEITISTPGGAAVRKSVQTLRVPMSRLNSEFARISRMGGQIESVKPL